MQQKIPIAELVQHVRNELETIHGAASGDALLGLSECEFEFALEAEREVSGDLKVWLLDLRGGGKKSESNTVQIKHSSIPGKAVCMLPS
ncbi:MAG: hypothetical protein NTAFB01_43490 [Nitrospira sp.]